MRQKIIFNVKILIVMTWIFCTAGFPCAAASPEPSAIHAVAVSPGSVVVTKNATCTFTATVTGENDYSGEVVWSVNGQTSQSTFIDSKGVLNVASDEGASSLVVKAVSKQDSAYSATALAVIQNATYRVNISVNDGNGGTATEGKTVNAGESMTVKATPKEGWRFVEWKENDKSIGNNQELTLENITGDRNLTAVFEKEAPKTYTVTASVSSAGGIITPTGASPVPTGSWIGYAITPDRGYRVRMVYVDGAAVGAATSYNFTDVHGDHTISAEFEADPAQSGQNQTGDNTAGNQQTPADDPEKPSDRKTNRTDSDDPAKTDRDKTDKTGKNEKEDTVKTDEKPDQKDKEAAQKEKEAAAKAEREEMERERMEKEKETAEAERAERVEREKERLEQEKAENEKAAQQKAEKQRQKRMIFGIAAAVTAACALGVFLVVRKRRG